MQQQLQHTILVSTGKCKIVALSVEALSSCATMCCGTVFCVALLPVKSATCAHPTAFWSVIAMSAASCCMMALPLPTPMAPLHPDVAEVAAETEAAILRTHVLVCILWRFGVDGDEVPNFWACTGFTRFHDYLLILEKCQTALCD